MPLSRAQLAIERSESSSSSHIVRIHVYIYARLYIWNPRRQRVCRRLYYVTHDNDWTKRWIPFDTRYRLFHIFSNERVWNWTCSAHFFRPTPKRAQHRYSHVPAGKQRYRGGPACATYIYIYAVVWRWSFRSKARSLHRERGAAPILFTYTRHCFLVIHASFFKTSLLTRFYRPRCIVSLSFSSVGAEKGGK